MSNKPVILDSSALIAEINLSDSLHQKAQAINDVLSQTQRKVILPYEVFAEALNFLARKPDGERQRVPERRSWLVM